MVDQKPELEKTTFNKVKDNTLSIPLNKWYWSSTDLQPYIKLDYGELKAYLPKVWWLNSDYECQ